MSQDHIRIYRRLAMAGAGLASLLSACGSSSSSATTTVDEPSTTVAETTTTPAVLVGCGASTKVGPTTDMWWETKSFGTVSVTAKFDDAGAFCGVSSTWDATLGLSKIINEEAMPQLDLNVTTAKTAKVNAISGATATSNAYSKSLQAALDAQ